MTKKIIQPQDKSIFRVSLSLTKDEDTFLKSDFENQSQYTTLATYAKAVVLGKAENRKSTILNVPSVNEDIVAQLKGTFSNLNQFVKHLNTIKLQFEDNDKLAIYFFENYRIPLELQKAIKTVISLIDKSEKNKSQVKAFASLILSPDDYLDLLSIEQLQNLIFKKMDQSVEEMSA